MKPGHQPLIPQTSRKKRCLYICCGMAIVTVAVLLAFIGAMFAVTGVNGYPIHASCKVTWNFGVSCQNASETLQSQIRLWKGKVGCKKGGQRCLYSLTSVTDNGTVINAKHETPVKRYVDDLTFRFTKTKAKDNQTAACSCEGFSTSETWYALLDYGTNYCNLHNLVTGSGLNTSTGYREHTADSQCTQFSSANCDKY